VTTTDANDVVTVNITGTVMLDAPVALRVIFPL